MTPSPFSAALLSQIEDAGLNASAPPQQLWLDGWLLRLSPGKAKRARCINALAAGRLPLPDRLAQAAARYQASGLPLIFRLTPFSPPEGLDDHLAAAGLQRFGDTCVLAASIDAIGLDGALPAGTQLQAVPGDDFAAIVGGLRGSPAAQQMAHAQRLAASPVPYRGWVLRHGDDVLACGQYAREDRLVGLYDIFTAPAARNQGLSRTLCAALLRQAAAEGAAIAYLQVDADNHPALAVYRRLGFREGYRYHYRAADPAQA